MEQAYGSIAEHGAAGAGYQADASDAHPVHTRKWQRTRLVLGGACALGVVAVAAVQLTRAAGPESAPAELAASTCAAALEKCSGGASYSGPSECCDEEYSCFAKTAEYSQCKKSCEEGWLCAEVEEAEAMCASSFGQCGGEGWTGVTSCCDEEYSCFEKSAGYSQCRKSCGSASDGWSCATEATTATTATNPHVVMVLADDLGWNDIGYGSEDLKGASPTLDTLAAEGVLLDNFYSQHLCSPARSALLTGRYPISTGMMHEEVIEPASPWGLNLSHTLLPQLLAASGKYEAHAVGKWHLGHYAFAYMPTARGFSSFTGYLSDQVHYFNHTYPQVLMGTEVHDLITATPTDFSVVTGKDGVLSDTIFRESMATIIKDVSQQADKSLFLYFASQATHGPLDDISDVSMFDDEQRRVLDTIENESRRRFAKLLMVLDQSVSTLMDTMGAAGMWDNTLLFFASDNGGCSKSGGYNNPLRGGKHFLFEGGIRVRAFVAGPALPNAARGTTYGGLMHISDLFPTILDVADVDVTDELELDSASHWDFISGTAVPGTAPRRTEIVHNIDLWSFPTDQVIGLQEESSGPRGALRRGDMKIITHTWPLGWYKPPTEATTAKTGVTGKEIEDCNSPPGRYNTSNWLFNISADPTEEHNLWHLPEYEQLRDELKDALDGLAETMANPSWVGEDPTAIQTFRTFHDFVTPWKDIDPVYETPTEDGELRALTATGRTSR